MGGYIALINNYFCTHAHDEFSGDASSRPGFVRFIKSGIRAGRSLPKFWDGIRFPPGYSVCSAL
jgi:hypothetical protein